MSRVVNLAMSEAEVVRHCATRQIAISVLEPLPCGGTRLVCSSASGAEEVEARLRRHIIKGDPKRSAFRPRRPLW
ncbi:MAG TPA: hypothetical protein VM346_04200 [Sphingomicrobium sp.]|nr:hypothetical protein [Sphingomicrobium sp.]